MRDSEVETKASVETEAVAEAGTDQEAEAQMTIKSINHPAYWPLVIFHNF